MIRERDPIKTSDATFDTAVIAIFVKQQLFAEGERLSFDAMFVEWTQYSLRKSDLFETLARLDRIGVLKAVPVLESLEFALTAEGARRVSSAGPNPGALSLTVGEILDRRTTQNRPTLLRGMLHNGRQTDPRGR